VNWKPALAAGIIVALLGIGAGLLIDGGGETKTTTVVQSSTPSGGESTTSATDTTTGTESTTTDETTTTPDVSTPIASTDATIAEVPMRVEITELARQGQVVTLNFTVTNLSDRQSDVFYRSFDDTTNGTAVDGLLMIDSGNGTEYHVIRRPDEGCLCSDELPFQLEKHQSVSLFATFDAPPPSTTKANITFPGSVGTLTDVPISG
jgi:hypothetical protein